MFTFCLTFTQTFRGTKKYPIKISASPSNLLHLRASSSSSDPCDTADLQQEHASLFSRPLTLPESLRTRKERKSGAGTDGLEAHRQLCSSTFVPEHVLLSRLVPALRSDRLHGKLHRYKNLPLFCPRHTFRERCGRGTARKQ